MRAGPSMPSVGFCALLFLWLAATITTVGAVDNTWTQKYKNNAVSPGSNAIVQRNPFFDDPLNPQIVYTGRNNVSITGYNITTQALLSTSPSVSVNGLATVYNGTLFYDIAGNTLTAVSIATNASLANFTGHTDTVTSMTAYPGYLLTTSIDQTVRLWNISTGQQLFSAKSPDANVVHGATMVNGSIWITTWSQHLYKYDLCGTLLYSGTNGCTGGSASTYNLYYNAGRIVTTCQFTNTSYVFAENNGTLLATMRSPYSDRVVAMSGFADMLVVSTYTGKVTRYNITTGTLMDNGTTLYDQQALGVSWDPVRANLWMGQGGASYGLSGSQPSLSYSPDPNPPAPVVSARNCPAPTSTVSTSSAASSTSSASASASSSASASITTTASSSSSAGSSLSSTAAVSSAAATSSVSSSSATSSSPSSSAAASSTPTSTSSAISSSSSSLPSSSSSAAATSSTASSTSSASSTASTTSSSTSAQGTSTTSSAVMITSTPANAEPSVAATTEGPSGGTSADAQSAKMTIIASASAAGVGFLGLLIGGTVWVQRRNKRSKRKGSDVGRMSTYSDPKTYMVTIHGNDTTFTEMITGTLYNSFQSTFNNTLIGSTQMTAATARAADITFSVKPQSST